MKIDNTLIQNFLTIRYDPRKKDSLKPASWKDFLPTNHDNDGKITEKLLLKSISTSIPDDDSPISISLSSGIDSSLSLALLRKSFPKRKINSICAIFDGAYDESVIARRIAEKFEANFQIVKINSIFENMPEIISISKKPRWNTYNHVVAREAKKKSNFLVTGDGADELFGGYVFRYNKYAKSVRATDNWLERTRKYLDCHDRDWVPDQEDLFGDSIKFSWKKIYEYFKPYFFNKLEPLVQVMLADYNGKLLHDFIPTGKNIFDNYQIHGKPIFLNSSIISFSQKLPLQEKYDAKTGHGKLILRQIAKRLKVDHIQEKKGFSPNLISDWQKCGRKICVTNLLSDKALIYEKRLISRIWVEKAIDKVDAEQNLRYLNRLISVLALEIWMKLFYSKEISATTKLN